MLDEGGDSHYALREELEIALLLLAAGWRSGLAGSRGTGRLRTWSGRLL